MNTNPTLSRIAADRVRAELKMCWKNAALTAMLMGAEYVEGYVVFNNLNFATDHGWCVIDGEIVDPTLVELHPDMNDLEYFPGVTHASEIMVKLMRHGVTLPLSNYRNERMRAAAKAAWARCEELTKEG